MAQNVELVLKALDAFNRGDIDALVAHTDPDIEFSDFLMEMEGGGSFRGHRGVRDWWESYTAVFPDLSGEISEVRDLGAVTLVHGRVRGRVGTGTDSEAPFEQAFWIVATWRDRQAVGWHSFRTEAEALEAIRQSEEPR
jgi:ketosteroid isomerase-like protein